MPTDKEDNVLCWGCGEIIQNNGCDTCPCGHKADLFERLGFDPAKCPNCDAHLRNGICLNACALTQTSRERFSRLAAARLKLKRGRDR